MVNNLVPPRVRAKLKRHLLDAVNQRGLIRGYRIEFRRRRHCELREFEDSMSGPGEVIVETALSAISPGTERAIYLGLPHVPFEYPYVPGWSQVGRIAASVAGACADACPQRLTR